MNDKDEMSKIYGIFDDTFGIEKHLDTIFEILNRKLIESKVKMKVFTERFIEEIKNKEGTDFYLAACMTVANWWHGPLALYALHMNGPAITDLHSILERKTFEAVLREISGPNDRREKRKLMQRDDLDDVAKKAYNRNLLTKTNCDYADKLQQIRNGLAHRNPVRLGQALGWHMEISPLDHVDSMIQQYDITQLLIDGVKYDVELVSNEKFECPIKARDYENK